MYDVELITDILWKQDIFDNQVQNLITDFISFHKHLSVVRAAVKQDKLFLESRFVVPIYCTIFSVFPKIGQLLFLTF